MHGYFRVSLDLVFTLSSFGLMPRTGEPSKALQFADKLDLPASDISRKEFERNAKANGADPDCYRNGQMVMSALALDPTMVFLSGFGQASSSSYYQIAAWAEISDKSPK